jgi:hypothetical protein
LALLVCIGTLLLAPSTTWTLLKTVTLPARATQAVSSPDGNLVGVTTWADASSVTLFDSNGSKLRTVTGPHSQRIAIDNSGGVFPETFGHLHLPYDLRKGPVYTWRVYRVSGPTGRYSISRRLAISDRDLFCVSGDHSEAFRIHGVESPVVTQFSLTSNKQKRFPIFSPLGHTPVATGQSLTWLNEGQVAVLLDRGGVLESETYSLPLLSSVQEGDHAERLIAIVNAADGRCTFIARIHEPVIDFPSVYPNQILRLTGGKKLLVWSHDKLFIFKNSK